MADNAPAHARDLVAGDPTADADILDMASSGAVRHMAAKTASLRACRRGDIDIHQVEVSNDPAVEQSEQSDEEQVLPVDAQIADRMVIAEKISRKRRSI